MRIAFVHSNEFPSLEADVVQVIQMCRAFAAVGQDVTLFVPRARHYSDDRAAREDISRLFGDGLPFDIVFVPFNTFFGRFKVLGTVRGTLNAIKGKSFDVIYTRNPWTVLFLPKAGIPYVFEAHEERVHLGSAFLNTFLRSTIVKNSHKSSCAMIVGISAALCKIWEGFGVPPEKLVDAHDGVELSHFDVSLSREDARNKLRLDTHNPVVVYAGSMKKDRGIDLILSSANQIAELQFYLVGGTDEEIRHWRSLSARRELSNVHFIGRVSHREIPVWLAAGDILLMMWTWQVPTIRGCSPMKMFEYMAAERLIVGPAFPTINEVLENGKDSILFEPDNLEAMVTALRDAIKKIADPSLPRAARKKVAEHYTWQARCRRIVDALTQRGIR